MRAPVLFLTLLLACSRPAAAQSVPDNFRQTIVVTAAAMPVELGSATRTVTVITRDEIDALPAHSVADVLRLAASVDVRARGERGVQSDFAVRGANFGQMLVLVDGVRLNDAQSGHHNGDIPVPLDAVERIEVLYGPGSSLFGADAFGGTVNVITRRTVAPSAAIEGGSSDLGALRGQAGYERGAVRQMLSGSYERSSGFMYDRDFDVAVLRTRASFGDRASVSASYLWKEFGANNFYGGNAPSREWTNQTLLTADHRLRPLAGWTLAANGSYRTHGDRFVFNQERPQLSDNRHRTHAVLGSLTAGREFGDAAVTAGVEGAGEWIRSTNLGDHDIARVSGFGEWRQAVGGRLQLEGALRVDRYDQFGTAWSPSVGAGWWAGQSVRLRASGGRAFRVPTFTERYYSDPANLARPEVGPETAWAGEVGLDLLPAAGWLLQATFFGRADHDVIDWLRPDASVRWRTYNIRDLDTRGIELSARRSFGGGFMHVSYTGMTLDAAAVGQQSKYVLDYAPRSFTAGAAVPLPGRFTIAPRIEYKHRSRFVGTANVTQDYVLLDARLSRRLGRMLQLAVEGTNLFDQEYEEIAGVAMPGAAFSISLAIRAR